MVIDNDSLLVEVVVVLVVDVVVVVAVIVATVSEKYEHSVFNARNGFLNLSLFMEKII